jgi:hypothetical protein
MKLQKNTLALFLSALFLGIGVAIYEFSNRNKVSEIKDENQAIFTFKVDDIQSLMIKNKQEVIQLERSDKPENTWQIIKPKQAIANDAVVSFLTNLLVNEKSDRRFPVSSSELKDYGLDQPFASIKIQLKDKTNYQLNLGKPDFQNQFIYAYINQNNLSLPPSEVLLIPQEFKYAVERDLSEWEE